MQINAQLHPSDRETRISERLVEGINGCAAGSVAAMTGYKVDEVQRFLSGIDVIPADFVGQVVSNFSLDANSVLLGRSYQPRQADIRRIPTDMLINEIGRRMMMIEDYAIGSAVLNESKRDDVVVDDCGCLDSSI